MLAAKTDFLKNGQEVRILHNVKKEEHRGRYNAMIAKDGTVEKMGKTIIIIFFN